MLKKWLIKVSTLIKKMFDLFINLMRSGGKWVFQSSLEYITTRPKQRQYSIALQPQQSVFNTAVEAKTILWMARYL